MLCVKWKTPAEELLGMAALVSGLLEHGTAAKNICIVAPNRTWAAQMQKACMQANVNTIACIAANRFDQQAQTAYTKLAALAAEDDEGVVMLRSQLGIEQHEAQHFIDTYRTARAFTLIRLLDLRHMSEFACALQHVCGDEDATTLAEIIEQQLRCPTLPANRDITPILCYDSIEETFDWILAIGCVNGLIPGPAAFEAPVANDRQNALDICRANFERISEHARIRAVISGFTQINADTAKNAHIRIARYKMQRGERLAMTTPTVFLGESQGLRPSTVGGQTLLREYNLN